MKINNLDKDYPKAWAKMFDFFLKFDVDCDLKQVEGELSEYYPDIDLFVSFDIRDLEAFFDSEEIYTCFGYETNTEVFEFYLDVKGGNVITGWSETRQESREAGFRKCFEILEGKLTVDGK